MAHQINKKLPEEFRKYFWDCNFNELSLDKYQKFVVERILNFGDIHSVRYILLNVDKSEIKNIISTSRNLNNKTKNFWKIMLNE
ncbi:hypothetical protein KJ656_15055 [bacterium]|nr:hypothetical protein [bacterium]